MSARGKAHSLSEFPPEKQAKFAICIPELTHDSIKTQLSAVVVMFHVLHSPASQDNPWGNTSPWDCAGCGGQGFILLHVTGCPSYREDQCGLWAAGRDPWGGVTVPTV